MEAIYVGKQASLPAAILESDLSSGYGRGCLLF